MVVEEPKPMVVVPKVEEPKKEPEIIKIEAPELEGPKILDKIDLSAHRFLHQTKKTVKKKEPEEKTVVPEEKTVVAEVTVPEEVIVAGDRD